MCKCCFGNIEGESCGWPRGTVRATIALITIPLGFLIACSIMVILIIKEQYSIALGVNSAIFGTIGTIVGYYFGSRQGDGAAKLLSDTSNEIIKARYKEIKHTNNLLSIYSNKTNNTNNDNKNIEMVDL